jgi:hypothetical protein
MIFFSIAQKDCAAASHLCIIKLNNRSLNILKYGATALKIFPKREARKKWKVKARMSVSVKRLSAARNIM